MNEERFAELAMSFPVLQRNAAEFLRDGSVDLRALDAWGARPGQSDSCRHAAAFALNCWSTYEVWIVGKFDMFSALRCWDDRQLAAFQAWVRAPWRP